VIMLQLKLLHLTMHFWKFNWILRHFLRDRRHHFGISKKWVTQKIHSKKPRLKCLEAPGLKLGRVTITRHLGIIKTAKALYIRFEYWEFYVMLWTDLFLNQLLKVMSLDIYFIYGIFILFAPYLVLMVHCRQIAWCKIRHLPRYQVKILVFRT